MLGPESHPTHAVFNQSLPFVDVDLYAADQPLRDAVAAAGLAAEAPALGAFGRRWGSAEFAEHARLANQNPPVLRSHDAKGYRLDQVEFHPAYHALMAESMREGLHAATWTARGTPAPAPAEVLRAARYYMVAQVEDGHMCPITMTRASLGALAAEPALRDRLLPGILSRNYDPAFRPFWEKSAITLGMGMTEKQGGTDVRANTTVAVPAGDGYALTGHKWFMSAPMCDAFLVLAQAPNGLTCFLLPRFRPDGTLNGIRIQRLKDKLGNRSNASSEVEFVDAFAWRVGPEGRGVRTILAMVQLTRVDCVIGSAGQMRAALAQALHHARQRTVFQRKLVDQPMMQAVLADMALELEGAVALMMRLCGAVDRAATDPREAAFVRLLTPAAKFAVCKAAPGLVTEALECLGGNGYVEEGSLARLYREAPLNAIWEGSGNVVGLDVLRAASDAGAPDVIEDLQARTRHLPGSAEAVAFLRAAVASPDAERQGRLIATRLAALAATAALSGTVPDAVTEAFARNRLLRPPAAHYGTADLAPAITDLLLARALAEC